MKTLIKYACLLLVFLTAIVSCKIEDFPDPNRPSLGGFLQNASVSQLNNLVVGALSQMRQNLATYMDGTAVIGREYFRFSSSDPRWAGDVSGGSPLDNNTFYTTNPYTSRYATIKNLNVLIAAVNNTSAVNAEEKNGYLGFANTIKAYELLMVLNQQYNNGIRVDVADEDNLGPFLSKDESLAAIANLLNEGAGQLSNAGASFRFLLSEGFAAFNTPATFREFNRALAARVAVYRGQYAEALTFLAESFLDLNGDLRAGAYYSFSTGTGDQLNPLFLARNATGEIRGGDPSFVAQAEAGDVRVNKVAARTPVSQEGPGPASQSGLSSNYDVVLYTSNVDPVPIIRNEELILIYAEAKIQTNALTDAVDALNIVRNAAELPNYAGPVDQPSLINEMLKQRRYSLFGEGHRWIDLRRYNRLSELPKYRANDVVHEQFPRPFQELGVQGG
jgi:starch-binding outer membrane protein, SusD/RagB family